MSYRIDPGTGKRNTEDLFADGFKNAEVKLSERQLLENLQHHYGEERYRPSSLLRQKALMEKHHEQ